MREATTRRALRGPLAGLLVAFLLAAGATLGLHCASAAADPAHVGHAHAAMDHAAHGHAAHGDPLAAFDSGTPPEQSNGLVALCVSVTVAVLLAFAQIGRPTAAATRAPPTRPTALLPRTVGSTVDLVRLCVLRT